MIAYVMIAELTVLILLCVSGPPQRRSRDRNLNRRPTQKSASVLEVYGVLIARLIRTGKCPPIMSRAAVRTSLCRRP
jgi:hypothetical protein